MANTSDHTVRSYSFWGVLVFAVIFLLVASLGIYSYYQLNGIATTLTETSRPNYKQLLVRQIQADLFQAENSVKTYELTRDSTDLLAYSTMAGKIEDQLDSLFAGTLPGKEWNELNHLDSLIFEKFELQAERLALGARQSNDRELQTLGVELSRKVRSNLAPNPIKDTVQKPLDKPNPPGDEMGESETNPEEGKPSDRAGTRKRKGLFRRLFKRKDNNEAFREEEVRAELAKASSDTIPTSDTNQVKASPPAGVELPRQVALEVQQFREREIQRQAGITEEMLVLTRKEQEISREIRDLAASIEDQERKKIAQDTAQAEQQAKEANDLIIWFCILLGAIILLTAFGIRSYTRANRQLRESNRSAKEAAESLAETREKFLATMSHEIRTPLNAVVGFTELALRASQDNQEQLTLVKNAASHLLGVVNDVLDISKLNSGAMTFVSEPFDLCQQVRICGDLVRKDALEKGLRLQLDLEIEDPTVVRGDALRLRQVLLNLLNNAIRFTEQGQVRIRVWTTNEGLHPPKFLFAVMDTGIGIPSEAQAGIFDEFVQVEGSGRQKFGGTGLGLAICKRIVEGQEGEIRLESQPGKGTTVTFQLPMEILDRLPEPYLGAERLLKQPPEKILIVDDNQFNRMLMAEVATGWGVEFQLAGGGREALDLLRSGTFDLILLDIRMPGISGLQVLEEVRNGQSGADPEIPVVALTATTSEQEVRACLDAGCNAVVPKPIELDKLTVMLGLETTPDRKVPAKESASFSFASLEKMGRGDQAFVRKMALSYLELAHKSLEGLATGNVKEIREIAHKLGPATRHMGATELHQRLVHLEKEAEKAAELADIKELVESVSQQLQTLTAGIRQALSDLN